MKPSKKTLNLARLIHVYVSMALLTLLLFFSVTGITLNHPEWFNSHKPQIIEKKAYLESVEKLALKSDYISLIQQQIITAELEQVLAISRIDAKAELMSDELFYSIKQAGQNSTIAVDLKSGEVFYEHTHYGWWAVLNDLHKGRNTSDFWSWIIDLSSALFIIFAITGFILAMPQKRFRRTLILSLSSTVLAILSMLYFA